MDHNSTTPLDPRVLDAMMPYLRDEHGNPSCPHGPGLNAKYAIEKARLQVAKLLGAKDSEILFTSGGTESNNLALRSAVRSMGKKHIITTAIEHPAILRICDDLQDCENCTVSRLPVDGQGFVNPRDVARALTARTAVVSVMAANNETGSIQPIAEIGRLLRSEDVLVHTDAVQAFGRIPLKVNQLGVHTLSLSAHKMYGPKGVGALYVREGTPFRAMQLGGAQELGRRAGTENVAGIVGLGTAAELA
ncbi:MAG: aminotransferase class V-fold PLP-dependent enzyme, partial [bacterium]